MAYQFLWWQHRVSIASFMPQGRSFPQLPYIAALCCDIPGTNTAVISAKSQFHHELLFRVSAFLSSNYVSEPFLKLLRGGLIHT
jgi:hypothetical protein